MIDMNCASVESRLEGGTKIFREHSVSVPFCPLEITDELAKE
jgi:hypothetical protein